MIGRYIPIAAFVLFVPLFCPAQSAAPSVIPFVGVWILDFSKSEPKNLKYDKITMTIVYTEPEFKIARHLFSASKEETNEAIYYTDGRGETLDLPNAGSKAVTAWNKGKLKRSYLSIETDTRRPIDVIEEWSVSKDGQVLTIAVFMQPFDGDDKHRGIVSQIARRVSKRVFRRL